MSSPVDLSVRDPLGGDEADRVRTQLLDRVVAQLSDHFDAVQILASVDDGCRAEGTRAYVRGAGNIFARLGQAQDWLDGNVHSDG